METLDVPQGRFALGRHTSARRDLLRAWDAADELALRHVAESGPGAAGGTWLVLNDGWGALATALAPCRPVVVCDSYLGRRASAANRAANGVEPGTVEVRTPLDDLPDRVDVVVVKVPKALGLLEHQLHRLRPHLHAGTVVVGAAMARHVHRSTIALFERLVGPTRTSLAVRKARLLHAEVDGSLPVGPDPWPVTRTVDLAEVGPSDGGPAPPLTVVAHAGVFSAGRLDIGTRLLLRHLPPPGDHRHVVDLGCGDGVVGTAVAARDAGAELTFVDESSLALASAEATWRATHGERAAHFAAGDALRGPVASETPVGAGAAAPDGGEPSLDPPRPSRREGALLADGAADLVLVNPPFHQDHAVGDATAWAMLEQARAALAPGGEIRVVGNRHLRHDLKLRRLFGGVEVEAATPKFTVLRATTP